MRTQHLRILTCLLWYYQLFPVQRTCFEQFTLNDTIDLKNIMTIHKASDVTEAFDIDLTQIIIEDLVGNIMELKGNGVYLRYYEASKNNFLLTDFELSNPSFELNINNSFSLKSGQKATIELNNHLKDFHNRKSCEFVYLKLETNQNLQISKISIIRRVT